MAEKTFINSVTAAKNQMEKKANQAGISLLSPKQFRQYEGKCIAIVDGEVRFSDKSAAKVLDFLLNSKGQDKVFSSVPRSDVCIVK